ncbi:MAG: alpha/beta hydrolase [Kordiimonadaceae bacterium]|nr:alpha/beta hydrolase [Kordiimonadaceae bacterium]
MSVLRVSVLLGGLAAIAACSPLQVLNLTAHTSGLSTEANISYGGKYRQQLNIYSINNSPTGETEEKRPVIIFFYGGSWKTGNRADYLFVAERLAELGYIVVVPDYRTYPEVSFPGFIEDGALAVKWVFENIRQFGGNEKQIFLAGHSAGAHIASMLAFNRQYLRDAGAATIAVKGVIGLAGPYAFRPSRTKSIAPIFAHLKNENIARPISFVDGKAPPMLLLHGASDTTVGRFNSDQMAAAIGRSGGTATKIIYPKIGHIGILLALSRPFKNKAPALKDIATFINRQISKKMPAQGDEIDPIELLPFAEVAAQQ